MKFFISVLLIAIVSFVAGLYLPWWSVALVAFIIMAFLPQKPVYAFLAGFIAIFLLWSVMAFIISSKNDHILAHKISIMVIKNDSPVALVFVAALTGALVAGFAALSASLLRKIY